MTTTTTPPEEPRDLFSILEAEARAVAAAFGVPTANELAAALIDRVHLRLQGDRIWASRRSKLRRQELYEAMDQAFLGNNLVEVARQFGYTPRHTYRILNRRK